MTSDTSNEYDLDWEPQTAGEALALQAAKHYRDGSVRQESEPTSHVYQGAENEQP